jgi:SAM-dependent methyltransferase
MQRSFTEEILDGPGLSLETIEEAHRALSRTHRLLGNHTAILRALRQDAPVSVLDIGCGHGGLLAKIRSQLGSEVIGVDLQPPQTNTNGVRILQADAVRESLPQADTAVSVCLIHHLRDEEFIELIRNVGRSCRRFVVLDLVRNPLPLTLFRIAAPIAGLPRINVLDGSQSIRRAYTGPEFRALLAKALAGPEGGHFTHRVSPFWIRQIADIRYSTSSPAFFNSLRNSAKP